MKGERGVQATFPRERRGEGRAVAEASVPEEDGKSCEQEDEWPEVEMKTAVVGTARQ